MPLIPEEHLNGYLEKSLQCWTLIVRFDDGMETCYHVDHVKTWIQGEEKGIQKILTARIGPFASHCDNFRQTN